MQESYTPSQRTLEKYADVIVRFGMRTKNGGKLKKGSTILFTVPEVAKPLYLHLQRAILKAGHNPLGILKPSWEKGCNIEEDFYLHASKDQLSFSPIVQQKALIDQVDGTIHIVAETNPDGLRKIDSKKLLKHAAAQKEAVMYRRKKIDDGQLFWTIALYGTDAMAHEASMTSRQYWDQIVKACYLKETDPVSKWESINKTVQGTAKKLSALKIKSVHMVGKDADLTLGIGKDRMWLAGGGCNIPSFEVFTSPTWQEVNGWIKLNQPHNRYGKKIEGIELWFENGIVVKSKATKNHDLLKSMLKTAGGNKLGEFSLTDKRLSKITKYMGEILYDENIGGKYGNTHIALGAAFRDAYTGAIKKNWDDEKWSDLGFNNSVVHSDVISTTDRTVTATLYDGTEKVIYKNGQFTI